MSGIAEIRSLIQGLGSVGLAHPGALGKLYKILRLDVQEGEKEAVANYLSGRDFQRAVDRFRVIRGLSSLKEALDKIQVWLITNPSKGAFGPSPLDELEIFYPYALNSIDRVMTQVPHYVGPKALESLKKLLRPNRQMFEKMASEYEAILTRRKDLMEFLPADRKAQAIKLLGVEVVKSLKHALERRLYHPVRISSAPSRLL